ncbi:MAG: 30S ribosomal protein S13 [Thaumarchaeota archaeon]|nr:30S ribosomal protein S13 [Nitrososphaerota archaeon]
MSEFRHIVRIAGRDLDGKKKVAAAVSDVKGVGMNLAQSLLTSLRIDGRLRLGSLGEQQISQIENGLKGLDKVGLPDWMLNRRKDLDRGTSLHLIGSDLNLIIKEDIEREKQSGSWRGMRHSLGLKVRGQRTRTTGRKGRTIGVKKVALVAAATAATAAAAAAPAAPAAAGAPAAAKPAEKKEEKR